MKLSTPPSGEEFVKPSKYQPGKLRANMYAAVMPRLLAILQVPLWLTKCLTRCAISVGLVLSRSQRSMPLNGPAKSKGSSLGLSTRTAISIIRGMIILHSSSKVLRRLVELHRPLSETRLTVFSTPTTTSTARVYHSIDKARITTYKHVGTT